MKSKFIKALSALTTVALLSSCGGGSGTETSSEKKELTGTKNTIYEAKDMSKNPEVATKRKDTLIIGTEAPDGVFNPVLMESAYDAYITEAMFDYLLKNNAEGEIVEGLAKMPEASDDGLTYTIKLQDNLKWSDGSKLTTKDVAFTIKLICDGGYDGPLDLVNGKTKIKGAKEYQEGTATDISGIEIVDDQTMKITLLEKTSSAIYDFATIMPMPESYYGKDYKQGSIDSIKTLNEKPEVSSGAYKFVSYAAGEEVKLVANENYYDGKAKIKNIIYKVTTEDTRLQMLQTGEIDMDELTIGQDNVESTEAAGFLSYQYFPTNGYGYMAFNHAKPALSDKVVRQALATALNREKIVDSVYDHYASVVNVNQSKVSWAFYEGKNKYEYDLEKAKKMLDDAGWKEGSDGIREKDGVKLSIHFVGTSNNPVVDSILSVATDDWKELGVDFTSEKVDFNQMLAKQKAGEFDMLFMAWGLTANPNDADIYTSNGSYNRINYSNSKVDELYSKINSELDQEKQKELYKELYTEINEDLPCIFMYQRSDMWVMNGRVKGFDISPYVHYTQMLNKITLEN
ncbi:Oligopeptide-binding protein AppA [Clostridium bornimense]|uniref:Oligopeptide-binding protein AppA n=1 Tax=Clostridium bornimense TaxID=1216932 RepID=W6RX73_9CLOT|nr:ABC transporter substrate-binding protein [Clostridium bornimense]CDM69271.1 Oligopeptide-binding protein AppA [Clostridium bornimense]